MPNKISVLFVCLGNICRSPAAENIFRDFVEVKNRPFTIDISSCGTASYHVGEPPDQRMQDRLKARGHSHRGRARQFTQTDFDRFDLIIAMDRDNLTNLQALTRKPSDLKKLQLFSTFLPNSSPKDVPDPYYGGTKGFDTVITMLEEGCDGILKRLCQHLE
ncbi:MAG: low molecular weight phosphotyrosine protein phosphatase [Halieaceae bacterium]|nr:low molecular weight phosphotyrosine protein phosphatase [Halieaceae bacterium]